jgi:hypothetical protein
VMSSRLAKVRLIHEAMEPDQYVEHMNGDLAQSIVGAVLRNRILNAHSSSKSRIERLIFIRWI